MLRFILFLLLTCILYDRFGMFDVRALTKSVCSVSGGGEVSAAKLLFEESYQTQGNNDQTS